MNAQFVKLMQIYEGGLSNRTHGQEGCSWRTLVLSSNLPLGVSIMIAGGRKGYSEGSSMRKWYNPPSNSVPAGPRMVQCHSYRGRSEAPVVWDRCGYTHEDIILCGGRSDGAYSKLRSI